MSGCKQWVLLGCLVSVGCREVPEDFSAATSGVVFDPGASPASSSDSGTSSDAASADAASDGSTDATSSDASVSNDGSAPAPDAQVPAGDGAVASDASMDAAADASAEGGALLADGSMADAAAGWPSGCTVHRVSPAEPIAIPAGVVHAPVIVLPAPWGDLEAQALAFRSIPDSPVLREMSLQAVTGNVPLALTGTMPIASPTLPADVGMYLPSGAASLRLRPQYDNRGLAATQDRSAFEICVVTGASRRPKTAGFIAHSPALPDVPAMVDKYDLRSRCRVHLSQPVQILAAQPFARKRAVMSRLAAVRGDVVNVIHEGAYSAADPKLIPLAVPATLTDGESLLSTCTYTNPSNESFSFGPGLEDEACVHYLLHVPRTTFSCTPVPLD